mmetsp:Transcript_31375/g.34727  ORF Transcript_31375/g.34727 Transcript_31375/m.34727 type:complete len:328 (-) Transcript_31375:163-1146(-)
MRRYRLFFGNSSYSFFVALLLLWYYPQQRNAFTTTITHPTIGNQFMNENKNTFMTKTKQIGITTTIMMVTDEKEDIVAAELFSSSSFTPKRSVRALDIVTTMMMMIMTILTPPDVSATHLPSTIISAEIKTMEFSLPSSYDSISDATANGIENLTIQDKTSAAAIASKKTIKSPTVTKKSDSTPAPKATVKPQQLTPEEKEAFEKQQAAEKEALAKERSAIREAAEQERKQLLAEKEVEKTALTQQKKAEQDEYNAKRASVREGERLAKKTAAVETAKATAESKSKTFIEQTKGGTTFSRGDFVDMGLPSYGSPSSTGKKDSPFAFK